MRKNISIAFFLLVTILSSSCASLPKKTKEPKRDTARLEKNIEARTTASGSGALTIKTMRKSVSASGILVVDWPHGLRLEVQNPMGGTVAFLVIDKNEFWSYSEEDGVAWQGAVDAPESRRFLPIPLAPEDFFRAILARPDLSEFSPGSGEFQLERIQNSRRDTLTWESTTDQLTEWRIHGESKGNYVEAKYADYFVKSGRAYPRKVSLSHFQSGKRRMELIWQWHDLETFLPAISNPFQIPPSWAEGITTKEIRSN